MATIRGIGGRVYLAASPTSNAVQILQARGWSLNIQQDLIENTQGFGQIWKTYLIASTGWKGSIDGNFDTAQTTPFDAANQPGMAATAYGPVPCYLYPVSTTMARYYYGTVWPNLSIDARLLNVVRFSLSFVGDGPLTGR